MYLINSTTKQRVEVGDVALTFHNQEVIVTGWAEPRVAGGTGRVYVQSTEANKWCNSYFPSVCGLEWVGEANY